jgi:anti-sigma regulatory factor (Ser/Thr protein kinase)
MEELSLHILDIAENAIRAGARNIEIHVEENLKNDRLTITIRDDGAGMDPETRRHALDPFFTTKEDKRVGLGLPLLGAAARRAGGEIQIRSQAGRGTEVTATFQHSHIDRQPLGDTAETMQMLIVGNPDVEFVFGHRRPQGTCHLETRGIKKALGRVPISSGEGIRMIREILIARGYWKAGG